MRLLIISDCPVYSKNSVYYSGDTFPKFVVHLAEHFKEVHYCAPVISNDISQAGLGLLPDIFGRNGDGLQLIQVEPHRTVLEYYRKLPSIFYKNFITLRRALKKCDAVLLRIPAMNSFPGYMLSAFYKKPVIVYMVGSEREVVRYGPKYKGLLKHIAFAVSNYHYSIYKRIIKKAAVSFFLSRKEMGQFRKQNNCYFTFTNLIADNDIEISNIDEIESGVAKILYVGRLSHEKGIEYLLKAIHALSQEYFDTRLTLCGDGPERTYLEKLSADLGIENRVEFLGFTSWGKELSEIYLRNNIFVLPSLSEGVPKVIFEAMAKGLPVITTNVGGVPDIISHMENGILVPPGDPEAIVKSIKLVIEDSALRRTMAENGYKFVKEHTARKQAGRISEKIYEHLGVPK